VFDILGEIRRMITYWIFYSAQLQQQLTWV